jgi:molybdopterin-guanine dinucleotide biosynthesis protein A
VVVLACDMPGVGPEVPTALVDALDRSPAAGVAVAVVGEREQPLTACWRRSLALPVLEAGFASGTRAPRHLLDALSVVRVPGLSPAALADVDSPEDLRRYAEAPPQTPTTEQDPP